MSVFAPMYQYFRGSTEFCYAAGQTSFTTAGCIPGLWKTAQFDASVATPYALDASNVGVYNVTLADSLDRAYGPTISVPPRDSTDGLVYTHIPYYCRYNKSLVLMSTGNTDSPASKNQYLEPSVPDSTAYFATGATLGVFQFFKNAGDDFQFLQFIGTPPLLLSKS